MCVPLILQNKLALVESYVAGHSYLEQRLVTLLDSWCHPSFSLEEITRYGASLSELCHKSVNAETGGFCFYSTAIFLSFFKNV